MKTYFTIIFIFLLSMKIDGQSILKFHQTPCENPDSSYFLKERIIEKQLIGDTLQIILGKKDPCCVVYKADYKVENDTLKLSFLNIGDECFCQCFYYLSFKIPNIQHSSIPVLFNNVEYTLTDQIHVIFSEKVDTLENGNIIMSKYEDDVKIWEIEKTPISRIYRQFNKGIIVGETKLEKEYE